MNYSKLTKHVLAVCLSVMLLSACSSHNEKSATTENQPASTVVNPDYEIASPEYSELAAKSLTSFANLDFEAWTATMSDDVVFYFPDGDAGTRTELSGKKAILDWWNNIKQPAYITKMTYLNHVDMPIVAKNTLPYSNLTGVFVISYFSNEMTINGKSVNLRMNVTVHFNSNKQIDRVYSYYDRTKVVEAVGKNILEKESK